MSAWRNADAWRVRPVSSEVSLRVPNLVKAAWLLAQKPFIVPIPGTGKVKHLQEIESTRLVLTAEDMKEIASALSAFKVHGDRMNEQQKKIVEQ